MTEVSSKRDYHGLIGFEKVFEVQNLAVRGINKFHHTGRSSVESNRKSFL